MSYLFVAYLYDKRRFSTKAIVDAWASAEPGFAGERLVRTPVSPRVDAVFYFPGNFRLKSRAFSFGCEAFLIDDWAATPGEALRQARGRDWQYLAWVSSDMSDYDVAMCFSAEGFEGRALIDGEGERVSVENGVVRAYERQSVVLDPRDLGFVSERNPTFDEEAFQRALSKREEPFRPNLLVHDTLGVTRGKVIDALHNVGAGQGEVLWPKGGVLDTPELREAVAKAEDPVVPALPLWEYLREEAKVVFPPPEKLNGKGRKQS